MHGLTGGSWKRDTDRATAAEKNDPRETGRSPRLRAYRRSSSPRQLPTLHRMSSGKLLSASGARGGDTQAAWRRNQDAGRTHHR